MMKFLRQHNRKLLAVLTALILVSWLIGEPLRELLSPSQANIVIGQAFGKSIKNADLVPTNGSATILSSLGFDWRMLAGGLTDDEPLKLEHWYMLTREASRAGVQVSPAEIDEFFQQQRIPPEALDAIRSRLQASPAQLREAVRELLLVNKYASFVTDVYQPSDREVRHFVRDTMDKIRVQLVKFEAKSFLNPDEAIDSAELAAQFEKYRAVSAAESPDGYGYKLPRRVRIEYLAARVDDLMPLMTVTDDDLRRQWRRVKDQPEWMKFEVREVPSTQPGPLTQPARQEIVRVPMTFEDARARLEEQTRRRLASSRVRDAMQRIASELARPWLGASPGPDGYKPMPSEVRSPTYLSDARERFEKQFGVPLAYRQMPLVSRDDLELDAEIGKAVTVGEKSDEVGIGECAFRVPPFFDASKAGELAFRLALFQTCDVPMYNKRDGEPRDHFVFRVIEVADESVPTSIDEVRDRVERDVRELRAYARARERARAFYVSAARAGMDPAYNASADLTDPRHANAFTPRQTPQFSRRESLLMNPDRSVFFKAARSGESVLQPPMIDEIGHRSAEFVDACFAMTSAVWTPPAIDPPASSPPLATAPADFVAPKTTLIELPRLRMVVVAALTDIQMVREDSYAKQDYNMGRQMLMLTRRSVLRADWFNAAQIERRCGFERTKTAEGEETPVTPVRDQPIAPIF